MKKQHDKYLIDMCSAHLEGRAVKIEDEQFISLNDKFIQLVKSIIQSIESEQLDKNACQKFSERIDQLLTISGDLTRRGFDQTFLDQIKEQLWSLLEMLNHYSLKYFKHSLW